MLPSAAVGQHDRGGPEIELSAARTAVATAVYRPAGAALLLTARSCRASFRDGGGTLAPLLAGASPWEQAAITTSLERLYELAVDARDETLKPEHVGTSRRPRARRLRRSV